MRKAIGVISLGCLGLVWGCGGRTEIRFTPGSAVVAPRGSSQTAAQDQTQKRLAPPPADAPLDISSDSMQYHEQGKVTVFKGRVKVQQEQIQLYTPYLELRSEDNLAFARQGVRLVDHSRGVTVVAKELDYRKNLSDVVVRDQVQLDTRDDQGQALRVRSQSLEWMAEKGIGIAQGDVVVHYQNITATAGVVHYMQSEQRLVLEPAPETPSVFPEMIQGSDTLTGNTITLQVKEKTYVITGSARAVILPAERQRDKSGSEGTP